MPEADVDVVVVGAGIAGIAVAFALSEAGAGCVLLVDEGAPLSLTSDKSTECYRNFWPGPDDAMLHLVDRSIRRMMEMTASQADPFQMRQNGYLFATTREDETEALIADAEQVSRFGGGAVRVHAHNVDMHYQSSPSVGTDPNLDGFDLITNTAMIKRHFPYLAPETRSVLHARRCGALSAQQYGMHLLEAARTRGVTFRTAAFVSVETIGGRVSGVRLRTPDGDDALVKTSALVLAPGPHLKTAAQLAGDELPVQIEAHTKISISDPMSVIPRNAPLIIWNDSIVLDWPDDEREMLAADPDTRFLAEPFPAGVHGRPVGAGDQVLMYWTYDCAIGDVPTFPMDTDPFLPEVTLRGMAAMVPGLKAYFDPMPRPYIDGGYYTKTADNRPLIGPLSLPGAYVAGAYSGYGIMASLAGGELLAAHVMGNEAPAYAAAFMPSRFDDPGYVAKLSGLSASAQL